MPMERGKDEIRRLETENRNTKTENQNTKTGDRKPKLWIYAGIVGEMDKIAGFIGWFQEQLIIGDFVLACGGFGGYYEMLTKYGI